MKGDGQGIRTLPAPLFIIDVAPMLGPGGPMNFAQIVTFFQTLSNMFVYEKITLSQRIYLRVPRDRITLVSLAIGDASAMRLSVNDAREIFRSIKRACDLHQVEEIRTNELSWKTDARINFPGQDTVVIQFEGPLGFTRDLVKREAATAAVIEFTKKFGLD